MYFKIVVFDSYYLASYVVSFGKELSTFPVITVSSKRWPLLTRLLLHKITASQLVKKFPAFYGTRRFITEFTRSCHLSLS